MTLPMNPQDDPVVLFCSETGVATVFYIDSNGAQQLHQVGTTNGLINLDFTVTFVDDYVVVIYRWNDGFFEVRSIQPDGQLHLGDQGIAHTGYIDPVNVFFTDNDGPHPATVFYSPSDGGLAIGIIDSGSLQYRGRPKATGIIDPAYDYMVASNNTVLFYEKPTGRTTTALMTSDAELEVHDDFVTAANWNYIITLGGSRYLFYRADGLVLLAVIDVNGGLVETESFTDPKLANCGHVAAVAEGIVFYRYHTRSYVVGNAFGDVWTQTGSGTLPDAQYTHLAATEHEFVFYRQIGGAFAVAHIDGGGLVVTQSGTLSVLAEKVVTRQGASLIAVSG
jgi:hypothetical protein